jgi:hypothetical protein
MTATPATPTTARKRRQTAQQDAVDCQQPREIVAPRPFHPVHRLYDLQSENPLRPPDWRYQAALQLVDRGELSDGDDALRTPILRLLHQLRPSAFDEHPSEAQLELYDRALRIYLGPAEPERAVLEAHLLAGRLAAEAVPLSRSQFARDTTAFVALATALRAGLCRSTVQGSGARAARQRRSRPDADPGAD